MKRIIACMLAVLMLALALAACGGPSTDPENKIADDTSLMALTVVAPETYTTVYRTVDRNTEGKLTEKDIVFEIDDDTKLTFAVMTGHQLSELMKLEDKETVEAGGVTFYLSKGDTYSYAYAQKGDDIYAIAYKFAEGASAELFDTTLQKITFTDGVTETVYNKDPEDLFAIHWTLDSSLQLTDIFSELGQDAEGKTTEKVCEWSFGKDSENVDMAFRIRVEKDKKLADSLDADTEYVEKEVNGITYSVKKDEEKPFMYYTQYGDDVYTVMNKGVYNGLWYTRSDESFEAFEKFLNTISFS